MVDRIRNGFRKAFVIEKKVNHVFLYLSFCQGKSLPETIVCHKPMRFHIAA
jgi:hypothetical protein